MFIRCNILYYALLVVHVDVLNGRIKDDSDGRRRRLTGGREEDNGVRPYAAYLTFGANNHCSGAIVSPTAELTSARCHSDEDDLLDAFAYAGNVWYKNREDFEWPTQIRQLSLCRRYNQLDVREYDIMVCMHETSWKFEEHFVEPVLIFMGTKSLTPYFKLRCEVAGFGRLDNGLQVGYLHAYHQVMQTWRACRDFPSDQFMCTVDTTKKTMCEGDAGGPVTCFVNRERLLFGILSASSAPEEECCHVPVAWNLITFLGYYQEWLMSTIPDLPYEGNVLYTRDDPETTISSATPTKSTATPNKTSTSSAKTAGTSPVSNLTYPGVVTMQPTPRPHRTQLPGRNSVDWPQELVKSSNGTHPRSLASATFPAKALIAKALLATCILSHL